MRDNLQDLHSVKYRTDVLQTRNNIVDAIEDMDPKRIEYFGQALRMHKDHWIYIAGNGGSAMNAGHFGEDLEALGYKVNWLGSNPGRATALTNDKPRDYFYTLQMPGFTKNDALVLFTVHGCTGAQDAGKWSQNLFHSANLCRDANGGLFVFSGLNGGDLAKFHRGNFITCSSGDGKVVEPFCDALLHLVLQVLEAIQ